MQRIPQHKLHFPATFNARDLGGYETANGHQTRLKSFVRSDNLRRLTPEGVQAVLDYGVRTVIDLRWPFELEMDLNPFATQTGAVQFVPVSLFGDSWETWTERAPNYDEELGYTHILDNFQPEMKRVMQALAHAPEGGVLFHCHAGKDRTGMVAMVLLSLAEVPADIIAADYAISAEYLKPEFEQYLSQFTDPIEREKVVQDQQCPPENALQVLAHLDARYGGAAAYLGEIGLQADEIESLRARLIQT